MEFRLFLERHAELLRSLPAWTIRLLVPRHVANAAGLHREAFVEQLTRPLPAEVVDEMRWYFRTCRDGRGDLDERLLPSPDRVRRPAVPRALSTLADGRRAGPRCGHVAVLADVVARRVGVLECHVLPYPYLHLLSLAGTA